MRFNPDFGYVLNNFIDTLSFLRISRDEYYHWDLFRHLTRHYQQLTRYDQE
jgi:hypothetical protein